MAACGHIKQMGDMHLPSPNWITQALVESWRPEATKHTSLRLVESLGDDSDPDFAPK
jgi:hypothetical protein